MITTVRQLQRRCDALADELADNPETTEPASLEEAVRTLWEGWQINSIYKRTFEPGTIAESTRYDHTVQTFLMTDETRWGLVTFPAGEPWDLNHQWGPWEWVRKYVRRRETFIAEDLTDLFTQVAQSAMTSMNWWAVELCMHLLKDRDDLPEMDTLGLLVGLGGCGGFHDRYTSTARFWSDPPEPLFPAWLRARHLYVHA